MKKLVTKIPRCTPEQQSYLDKLWLATHSYELSKEHTNQYAAICEGKLFVAPTHAELLEKLGDKADQAAILYIEDLSRHEDRYIFVRAG